VTLANPSTALATVLVDELARNGIRRAVLAPGSRSAAIAFALASHPGVALTTEIDERSAGFLALGCGLAGEPAVVVTTSGTAAANLMPAVVEADAAGVPMLVLTADRPPELRRAGANQVIDQVGLYGERARFFADVAPAEDASHSNPYWRSLVCQSVAAARGSGGRPGPVHLNVGFREPTVPASDDGRTSARPFAAPVDGRRGGGPWSETGPPPVPPRLPLAGRWLVERGLVIAGECGGGAGAVAGELASALGWPLIAEPHSGARGAGAVTTAHYVLGNEAFMHAHLPEVVIQFGRVGLSRRVAALADEAPARVVFDPWTWPDPGRTAAGVFAGLPELPAERPSGSWLSDWRDAEAAARAALDAALDGMEEPTEPRTARDLARIAAGRPLVVGSSMPVRDLDLVMEPGGPEVLSNRGASGIDGFVSTALGVAWARGPVLALAGDLSMLHDQSGLLADPRPPVVFVVNSNDGGGLFHFLPQAAFPAFERLFATPHHRRFDLLADLHGLEYARVGTAADLEPAVAAASAAAAGGLVEVPGDRIRNVEVHEHLEKAVAAALS
jgi:2-succinyl-5-enolpyruvyl-6-hydroxy-3-cyclohexene-1-carboxylate synthase